jgi:hypothetical protein
MSIHTPTEPDVYDVIVVGYGPAGVAAETRQRPRRRSPARHPRLNNGLAGYLVPRMLAGGRRPLPHPGFGGESVG